MLSMGERYAEGVILDLEKTWEESDPRTPLICFLSMGSDPTDSIIALGKRQRIETRYVSMGQGQEVHARKLLQHSMANVCTCSNIFDVESASLTVISHSYDNVLCFVYVFIYFLLGRLGFTSKLSSGSAFYG